MKPMGLQLTDMKGVFAMSNLENVLKESLGCVAAELTTAEENKQFYESLTEAGLNPRDYRADQHDYTPFLLQIAIDGQLEEFTKLVEGKEQLVASVFKVIHPEYVADLATKFKRAYGVQAESLKTKIMAVAYIARHLDDATEDRWVKAYTDYQAEKAKKVADQKAIQAKLV